MKKRKISASEQTKAPNPPMKTGQKFSTAKRNPITASAKGWPAPKKSSCTSGVRRK